MPKVTHFNWDTSRTIFTQSAPALSSADLDDLESKIGWLPKDFRQLYSRGNGGIPSAPYFDDDWGGEWEIDSFMPVKMSVRKSDRRIEDWFHLLVSQEGDSFANYIPLASDPG